MTALTEIDWADVLGAAVLEAARSGPVGAGNEVMLHRRLRDSLRIGGVTKPLGTEGRLQNQACGWTRSPGGIDVVAIRSTGDGGRALGIECKVGKPDELLWDAIKLGQRCDNKPWNLGLEAASLVVELPDRELGDWRARWFDAAVTQVNTIDTIVRWPEAWYGLMCGGRGIRPTSLPRTLTLGPGGNLRHPGGGSALCWRLVTASPIGADVDRVRVDTHGWPPEVDVPAEWRRQIDRAAEKAPERPVALALRPRRTLDKPPDKTIVEIVVDAEGRLWADGWDNHETVPTSFRLSETDPTRYDVRRSKNDALACANPPERVPAWCSRQVAEALARSGIRNPPR